MTVEVYRILSRHAYVHARLRRLHRFHRRFAFFSIAGIKVARVGDFNRESCLLISWSRRLDVDLGKDHQLARILWREKPLDGGSPNGSSGGSWSDGCELDRTLVGAD